MERFIKGEIYILLIMDVRFPSRYQVLYDMIISKTRDPPNTSVLELGCSNGDFVEYLRHRDYNAEGVDGSKRAVEDYSPRQGYLHHGELTALEDIFGQRQFDLIVARGVFCISSRMNYLLGEQLEQLIEAAIARATIPKARKEIDNAMQENINEILVSAYGQLTPGGFLMVREDVALLDSVDFSRETAGYIGYIVEQLQKQQAILQKPH